VKVQHSSDIRTWSSVMWPSHLCLAQCFSTLSLKEAKSRFTTLLEGRTKNILTQPNWHTSFYYRTKSITQNIRGLIKDCWEPHKVC